MQQIRSIRQQPIHTQKHKQTQSRSLPILQMTLFKMKAEKCSVQAERHYSC